MKEMGEREKKKEHFVKLTLRHENYAFMLPSPNMVTHTNYISSIMFLT